MAELTIDVTDELLGELTQRAEKTGTPIESVATQSIQAGLFPTCGLGANRCLSFNPASVGGVMSGLDPELFDAQAVKQQVIDLLQLEVTRLLTDHGSEIFSGLALAANVNAGEICVYADTDEHFEAGLAADQHRRTTAALPTSRAYVESEEYARTRRMTPGLWHYEPEEYVYVISAEQLEAIEDALPDDNYRSWAMFTRELTELFCDTVIEFREAEVFQQLKKTRDFMSICVEHGEPIEDSLVQMRRARDRVLPSTPHR